MSDQPTDKSGFLYPRSRYYGKFTPQELAFNANLQEFAHKIGFICNLETGGKISSDEAYEKIRELWGELKASRKGLEIGKNENPGRSSDSSAS